MEVKIYNMGSMEYGFGKDIYIKCDECGAKIQICLEYGAEELVNRWNRRADNETD